MLLEKCAGPVPGLILALTAAPLAASMASAQDSSALEVTFRNGVVTPAELHMPAGTIVQLTVINDGDGPAEFESKSLHIERVIGPHMRAVLTLRNLVAGEYAFVDEFTEDMDTAHGMILVDPAE